MQYKGREKAAKVVEFVAKWLNLCLSTEITYHYLFSLDTRILGYNERNFPKNICDKFKPNRIDKRSILLAGAIGLDRRWKE